MHVKHKQIPGLLGRSLLQSSLDQQQKHGRNSSHSNHLLTYINARWQATTTLSSKSARSSSGQIASRPGQDRAPEHRRSQSSGGDRLRRSSYVRSIDHGVGTGRMLRRCRRRRGVACCSRPEAIGVRRRSRSQAAAAAAGGTTRGGAAGRGISSRRL